MREHTYIECSCDSPEHVVRFSVTNHEGEGPLLEIDVQLNHYLSFWNRLKAAALYVLGKKGEFSHFDNVMLNPDQANRLYILIHQYHAARTNYEIQTNASNKKRPEHEKG